MIACIKRRYKSMIAKSSVNLFASGYVENLYKIEVGKAEIRHMISLLAYDTNTFTITGLSHSELRYRQ